ncbi:MAG: response regulator [Polaribacter sp.]
MAIKVVIADDHPLVADGIKNAILKDKNFTVTAVLKNGKEALNYIEKNTVDLLLLDIDMPIMNGIECASALITNNNPIKIVMLSMHQDTHTIKKLIDLGVKSYLLKTVASDELIFALHKVYEGESYFNADITKAILENKPSSSFTKSTTTSPLVNDLTKREKEVIALVCKGLNNTEIGDKLFISPKTVDVHRTNVMRKLDIHNVVSLVRFALRNNLST